MNQIKFSKEDQKLYKYGDIMTKILYMTMFKPDLPYIPSDDFTDLGEKIKHLILNKSIQLKYNKEGIIDISYFK